MAGGYHRSKADAELIDTLTRERDAALADAASWKREWELYSRAWLRALDGKLFPKSHHIDALVKTTRHLQENYEAWKTATGKARQMRADLITARTLGIPPDDAIRLTV